MNADFAGGDPRVILALTLISLGLSTAEKLRAVWKEHGANDADLDAIVAEVDRRLARRGGSDPNA